MTLRKPLGYFSFSEPDLDYLSEIEEQIRDLSKEESIVLASFALQAHREGYSVLDMVNETEDEYPFLTDDLIDDVDQLTTDGYVQLATALLY